LAPIGVDVAERPAAEGREAEAEDRADVAVARAPEDALAEAVRGLVDHEQGAALGDLVGRQVLLRLDDRGAA
jgi:hypothetical protein